MRGGAGEGVTTAGDFGCTLFDPAAFFGRAAASPGSLIFLRTRFGEVGEEEERLQGCRASRRERGEREEGGGEGGEEIGNVTKGSEKAGC